MISIKMASKTILVFGILGALFGFTFNQFIGALFGFVVGLIFGTFMKRAL